jgi:hypothetical protein
MLMKPNSLQVYECRRTCDILSTGDKVNAVWIRHVVARFDDARPGAALRLVQFWVEANAWHKRLDKPTHHATNALPLLVLIGQVALMLGTLVPLVSRPRRASQPID